MTEFLPHLKCESIWEKAKDELKSNVSGEIFDGWFAKLSPVGESEKSLKLEAPCEFDAIWIRDNYMDVLKKQVSLAAGCNMDVEISYPERAEIPREKSRNIPSAEIKKPEILPPSINPRNTFENFVVGEANKFAHAAALAVAQNIGVAFNPLFIYGSTGLGKTHLMHAIAQFVMKNKPEARIVYLTSENFVNEYVDALKEGNLVNFRKRHRNTDVLLIDDVQFFAGKERCQDEFFHTFNELFNSQKQIVLSCDKPLNEVADIEQRLVSRFGWGVSVDIQAPDYEMRLAILRKKISEKNDLIPPEVMELLARRFTKNIRRMEGALNKLTSYASLINSNNPITLEKAQMLLADALLQEAENRQIDVAQIQQKVSEFYRIDPGDMTGKRRPANIVMARQVAMFISRKLTTHSLVEIGKMFGNRDHGTVMHAIKVVDHEINHDENVRRAVEHLMKTLSI